MRTNVSRIVYPIVRQPISSRLREPSECASVAFGVGGELRLAEKPQGCMPNYAILDSCEETKISRAAFIDFQRNRDRRSKPINFAGRQWEFWGVDEEFGMVCLFRKEGTEYIGLKAELVDPELMSFERQASDPAAVAWLIKRFEVERLHSDYGDSDGKYLPFWELKALENTLLGLDDGFGVGSFHICNSDKELFDNFTNTSEHRAGEKQAKKALIRKGLCFVRRDDDANWLVMDKDTVLKLSFDISGFVEKNGQQGMSDLLKTLRDPVHREQSTKRIR